MAEKMSIQSTETVAANGGSIVPTEEAVILLARIDAMLDELYAIRQTVRQWADAESDASVNNADVVREPVKELIRDTTERVTIASTTHHTVTPLTDSLFGAAGQGSWDEISPNAEIENLQFGEPINATDLISQLSGSLGPAKPDEFEYFNSFDLAWERFAE